jgi:hypothetical protein
VGGQNIGDILKQVFLGELAGGQIDGDAQTRQALLLPGDVLQTGRSEYPLANGPR